VEKEFRLFKGGREGEIERRILFSEYRGRWRTDKINRFICTLAAPNSGSWPDTGSRPKSMQRPVVYKCIYKH